MKNLYFIAFLLLALVFSGCENFMVQDENHRVIFYNTDNTRFITEIRFRDSYNTDNWSRNQLYDTLYPGEQDHLDLYRSTYDFKIEMEDADFYYTLYEDNVYVDYDMRIEVCYNCNYNKPNMKIEIRKK